MLVSVFGQSQFLIFLDRGDNFKSPETDMVVMDKYSFARLHYQSQQYDTLKREVWRYDSLLTQRDCTESQIRQDYGTLVKNKDAQILALTDGYFTIKGLMQASIERQNQLQLDYLKLESRNRKARRWRNFFMGTSVLCGGLIYMLIRS